MLRIEGGVFKGRRLEVPKNKNLRPSASKTKLAIFNILEAQRLKLGLTRDFSNANCADLFAGVGSLGLEALSRGAQRITFVEQDKIQLRALASNVKSLECEASVTIIAKPVQKCWAALMPLAPFDLIFMDPPYAEHDFVEELKNLPLLMAPDAWLVLEHDPKLPIAEVSGLALQSTRSLGPAGISVYRKLS